MIIIPSPPVWMSARMMILPPRLKTVAVSTTISPVTHTAEVAVKRELISPRPCLSTVVNGSMRSSVPVRMISRKLESIARAGLSFILLRASSTDLMFSKLLYVKKILLITRTKRFI